MALLKPVLLLVRRVNLEVIMARQYRVDEAIEQFQIALAVDPNSAEAREYLRQVSQCRNQHR